MADEDQNAQQPVFPEREDHVYGKTPGVGDWKRITRLSLLGLLVVYAVLFFLMNNDTVPVSLVVATVSIPLVWALLLSFVLGAAVMYLLMYLRRRAVRKARQP
ncbi:MAG: LapA family protein [Candidatus Nanopelagicales bacterium]